ncbi:hypothetical protein MES5069_750112 [Mesorhizobium escarrei]|uniref:DNA methylase adenine-specific domain-containing protein n=1 Tax=Mesorhizobium escarrei TaxID=666018 RepID=A0ABM9EJI8_9HYPH|nr:hypothetical protein MES5069_750112 [Mesorhizobium escarrei]
MSTPASGMSIRRASSARSTIRPAALAECCRNPKSSFLGQNDRAELALFGQEYNDESWAICCSDMLIKDEDTSSIVLGDTLGDGKTRDGFNNGERSTICSPTRPLAWNGRTSKRLSKRSTRSWASPAASVPGCPRSMTARCCFCST